MEFYSGQPDILAASVRDYCTGVLISKTMIYVSGRNQHVLMNRAAIIEMNGLGTTNERMVKAREIEKKASEIMENDM